MSDDHLCFAVYEGTSEATMPVTEALAQAEAGELGFTPYLGMVNLDLTVGGVRRWPSRAGIGDLARLCLQAEAAADRLAADQVALLRSAVDDGPVGGYFLFEPAGEQARVSMLSIADPDWSYRYPVDRRGRPVEDVYRYVAEQRDTLLVPIDEAWQDVFFADLSVPRDLLIDSLRREAAAGRRLYEVLDVPFYLEL
jgi:hypothetical protein